MLEILSCGAAGLSVRALSEICEANSKTVLSACRALAGIGVLRAEPQGRMTVYSLNSSHQMVSVLIEMFQAKRAVTLHRRAADFFSISGDRSIDGILKFVDSGRTFLGQLELCNHSKRLSRRP